MISLLIGVVICMISAVTLLTLYKTAIFYTYSSDGVIPSSEKQQTLDSAFLSVQNLIQGAGFGIASATVNEQFILVNGAVMSASDTKGVLSTAGSAVSITTTAKTGNALFWIENDTLASDTSAYTCHGLVSNASDKSLLYLSSSESCASLDSDWNTRTWTVNKIASPGELSSQIIFTVSTSTTPCMPYNSETSTTVAAAMNADETSLTSSVSSKSGLNVQFQWDASGNHTQFTSCLINF